MHEVRNCKRHHHKRVSDSLIDRHSVAGGSRSWRLLAVAEAEERHEHEPDDWEGAGSD